MRLLFPKKIKMKSENFQFCNISKIVVLFSIYFEIRAYTWVLRNLPVRNRNSLSAVLIFSVNNFNNDSKFRVHNPLNYSIDFVILRKITFKAKKKFLFLLFFFIIIPLSILLYFCIKILRSLKTLKSNSKMTTMYKYQKNKCVQKFPWSSYRSGREIKKRRKTPRKKNKK